MPWARFDELFPSHRKVRRLSDAAFRLHVSAICWSCQYLSDGEIASDDLVDVSEVKKPTAAAAELVRSGRWHEPGHTCESEHCRPVVTGWLIHNFLEYQPSRADIEATRSWDRKRQSLYRDKELVEAIKRRDQGRCRYCGQLVNWTDRRSTLGGQLDHVIPRGPNTLENIVVACRGCNTRKSGRTPTEAGMPLLGPGGFGPSDTSGPISSDTSDTEPSDDFVPTRPDPTRPLLQTPTESARMTVTQRSKRITDEYTARVPLSNWPAINGVVIKALKSERYADTEIHQAMLRLADAGRSVTVETLRTELEGFAPRPNKATERTQQGLAIVRKLEAEQQHRGEIA